MDHRAIPLSFTWIRVSTHGGFPKSPRCCASRSHQYPDLEPLGIACTQILKDLRTEA